MMVFSSSRTVSKLATMTTASPTTKICFEKAAASAQETRRRFAASRVTRGGNIGKSSGKVHRNQSVSSKRSRLVNSQGSSVNDIERYFFTTAKKGRLGLDMGRYGLKRIDYANVIPKEWHIPPHPPNKSLADKIIYPSTLLFLFGLCVYVYMNPEEEDMVEYWRRVERGQIMIDDDDDDDDEWEYVDIEEDEKA